MVSPSAQCIIQLTFLHRGAQWPPARALPFLKKTISDGICGAEENSQADLGGSCGFDRKGPGLQCSGVRVTQLLLPKLGCDAYGAEPLHSAQVRKRVQEKGNPLSEGAGWSVIKPRGDRASRV